jgi:uncharacterized protein
MPEYRSPGVYVEEIPSAVQAIAGVSTSTAGFIAIAPAELAIPLDALPSANMVKDEQLDVANATDAGKTIPLPSYPVDPGQGAFKVSGTDTAGAAVKFLSMKLVNDHDQRKSFVVLDPAVAAGTVTYNSLSDEVKDERIRLADGTKSRFNLKHYPVVPSTAVAQVTMTDAAGAAVTVTSVNIDNDDTRGVAFVEIQPAPAADGTTKVTYRRMLANFVAPEVDGPARLCTNFSEFTRRFGGFPTDQQYRNLVHAVYGFFYNGGSRCFVNCVENEAKLDDAFAKLAAVDEVAIIAAPGLTSDVAREKLMGHCELLQDRFAVLDSKQGAVGDDPTPDVIQPPRDSNYAAFYFPWLRVFDPATKTLYPKREADPNDDGKIMVPPSGHIAGIYARVDVARGVHKAPANETVIGALGLMQQISKSQQDGLNLDGINCIRDLNGSIRVWGARTIGGGRNGEFRYINVRRAMLFLRESIDEGVQWAVFEPNDQKLWAKIILNVSAFLTTQWRLGMLFGSTAAEAFYVKCDAETNPPELREVGQVVTEIGVSIVKPAEFVIFRISQWQPPQRG